MPGTDARPLPAEDLRHVLEQTPGIWEDLRGARLFVTGGTRFFGRWMLESFLKANDDLGLGAEATVLTRDPTRFATAAPHVAGHPAVKLHRGDVRTFAFPDAEFTHVLHMATEAGPGMSPLASFRTAVAGTERVLALAGLRGVRKLLVTSSGAVYGAQPPDLERVPEEYVGGPRPEDAARGYGHGKRAAEYLCAVAAATTDLEVKIARCFVFVGPLLPLDEDYAIGNFFGDALSGDHIDVKGDGTARRSYLYGSDLAVWLWTILVLGQSGRPYNVGSEVDVSIAELAEMVAQAVRPGVPVRIAEVATGAAPARYVPSTARARSELGLQVHVMLDEALRRTAQWHRGGPARSGAG